MRITINGNTYTPELIDGFYTLDLILENAGRYPMQISYLDEWDDLYEEDTYVQVFPWVFNLAELKKRCEAQGFNYVYGLFKTPQEPPHLCAISSDSTNFIADNLVYNKKTPIQLDYTYKNKDLSLEDKIEDIILGDIPWEKSSEVYLSDEKVWQVSYFFEILGG